MNNELHKINLTGWVIGVSAFIVNVIIIFIIISSASDMSGETSNPVSDSEGFLMSTYTYDLPNGEKITSSSAKVYNQTWLNFDGVNDWVNVSRIPNLTLSNMTLSIRLKSNFSAYSSNSPLRTSTDSFGITQYSTNKDVYVITFTNESNGGFTSSSGGQMNLNDSNWHIITGTLNIANQSLSSYIDNFLLSTNQFNGTGLKDGVVEMYLGTENPTTTRWFNGTIDYVRIYNYTLSRSEVNLMDYLGSKGNYSYPIKTINESTIISKGYYQVNKSSSIVYANNGSMLKSTDNGKSWTNLCENCADHNIFISNSNSLFSSYNYNLTFSLGNDTNWSTSNIFICNNTQFGYPNVSIRFQGMDEDSYGNLYVGEYSDGNGSEQCGYVHRSTDGGHTWTTILNASAYGGYPSRHIHIVQVDDNNNCLYVTTGDQTAGRNASSDKLFKSCNNGTTWTILKQGNVEYQYLVFESTNDNCRIFGTDSTSGLNKIVRTCDDITFTDVKDFTGEENGLLHASSKDRNGILYFGTTNFVNAVPKLYYSSDNGLTWNLILTTKNTSSASKGFNMMSDFDINNHAYIDLTDETDIMLDVRLFTKPVIDIRLNENTGTTAYDSSGNGNNGTISGATWQNDGVLVSLTEDTDFSINKVSGILTLLNPTYLFSYITASWTESNIDDSVSVLRGNVSAGVDVISGKIPLLFLVLIIGVILIVLGGLTALFYLLMKKVPSRFSGGV